MKTRTKAQLIDNIRALEYKSKGPLYPVYTAEYLNRLSWVELIHIELDLLKLKKRRKGD